MKKIHLFIIIAVILIIDQVIKIYIKTHYFLGEEHNVLGDWFRLHFVENEGMAWGMKFGGDIGKKILTLFRLVAVIWGAFFIGSLVRQKVKNVYLICGALIFAGAAGNLIDSIFYGKIFTESYMYPEGIAKMFPTGGGYAPLLHGKVVDMFYFPLVNTLLPSWVPFWGGQQFTFFDPVFNFADASISVGVTVLLIHELFFKKKENPDSQKAA